MICTESEASLVAQKLFELYGFLTNEYKITFVQKLLDKFAKDYGITSFETLLVLFASDETLANDFRNRLFVNFSEMFRDPQVFAKLREIFATNFKEKNRIKIWCAGCAAGQEPYSLVILLNELGLLEKSLIYATDTDPKSLKYAEDGRYANALAMKYAENYYLGGGVEKFSKYFDTSFSEFKIKDKYKKHIKFAKHDLLSNDFFGEFDMIFARNIFIYLKESSQALIIKKVANSLCDGGFFVLGQNEILHQNETDMHFSEIYGNNSIFASRK